MDNFQLVRVFSIAHSAIEIENLLFTSELENTITRKNNK